MRSHYSNDPRRLNARYPGTCPDCGEKIKRGDDITYWPSEKRKSRRARHWRCSKADYQTFVGAAEDEYILTRGGRY